MDCTEQLTFQSLAITLLTTRFNIQKLYTVLKLRLFLFDLTTNSDFCLQQPEQIGFV